MALARSSTQEFQRTTAVSFESADVLNQGSRQLGSSISPTARQVIPSTLQLTLAIEIIWNGFTFFEWQQELIFRALPGGSGIYQISRRLVIQPEAYPIVAVYAVDPDPLGPRRDAVHRVPNRRARDTRYTHEIDV